MPSPERVQNCSVTLSSSWIFANRGRTLRPNSSMLLGQKSSEFPSLLFTVTSTNGFFTPPPPPPEQKWSETGLYNVNFGYRETSSLRLCPEASTKLYVHDFSFCTFWLLSGEKWFWQNLTSVKKKRFQKSWTLSSIFDLLVLKNCLWSFVRD